MKSHKWDPTPDLVILDDDDSTPLPGKVKGAGKKARTHYPAEDEGFEALSQCLKGEARAVQYNLELATLTEYRNLHIQNLKGLPNTDDHLAYLSIVKDVSWSYPAKGNLITARQFFKDLRSSKDREAIEVGDNVLWEKGMVGIPQEIARPGPSSAGMSFSSSVVSRARSLTPSTRTTDRIGISDSMTSSAWPPQERWRSTAV